MVSAPVSQVPGAPSRDRVPALLRRAFLAAGPHLLAGVLTGVAPAIEPASPEGEADIVWHDAFLTGYASIGDLPRTARSGSLRSTGNAAIVLNLVLEGERDGLPIFCTAGPGFRRRGRAIPDRLVTTPQDAGLADSEIHWVALLPTEDATSWRHERIPAGDTKWTLALQELPGATRYPRLKPYGTVRFAAAISLPDRNGKRVVGSSGWKPAPEPNGAPGFRVIRAPGSTLPQRAIGLARLPVLATATETNVRERVALRPVDVVLTAYEEMTDTPLPGPRDRPLSSDEWSWLFDVVHGELLRRTTAGSALVARDARPVPWAEAGGPDPRAVQFGDVLRFEGGYAILEGDDGDGWLGLGDAVVHAALGTIDAGTLEEVPGETVTVLRPRNLREVRKELTDAGYGPLREDAAFSDDLFNACRSFQHDHDLPVTGVPDAATRSALRNLLERMRASDGVSDDDP